jgi:hypothetical protein
MTSDGAPPEAPPPAKKKAPEPVVPLTPEEEARKANTNPNPNEP